MPYQRPQSPYWWVAYTGANGERIRRSTGTTDRKEAEALEAKWKLEAHQLKQWGTPPPRSWDEVMLEYLKATPTKRSRRVDLMRAKTLRAHFGGIEIATITAPLVRRFIQARLAAGRANGTINRELALASVAVNWCNKELDWQLPNPFAKRKLPEPEGRLRWLTREEAERLIEAGKPYGYLADFIQLALHTGLRSGELLHLEWSRVDLIRNLLYLEGGRVKSGKRRTVPLNEAAHTALIRRARFRAEQCPAAPWVFAHPDGRRLTDLRGSFKTACQVAEITDFHIHDLRHTFASWLVQEGVSLAEIRDLLGHKTVTMTERYAHVAPENLRAATERLTQSAHTEHHRERIASCK
jgi:integrase